jgi:hypothetical protein
MTASIERDRFMKQILQKMDDVRKRANQQRPGWYEPGEGRTTIARAARVRFGGKCMPH